MHCGGSVINISNGEYKCLPIELRAPSHAAGLFPSEELSVFCCQCSSFLSTCSSTSPLSAQLPEGIGSQNYLLSFVFDRQPNIGWASSLLVEFSIFLWMISSPGKGYEKSFKLWITEFSCLCCRKSWQDSGPKGMQSINVMY